MPPVLALKGATVHFGGPPLFAGLDVGIERGERVCLVGRNGCGKSTLLKALAGLVDLDAGERFAQPALRVAYLPQEAELRTNATIAEHVAGGIAGAAQPHRVDAILDRLGLEATRQLDSLSGGEARRVGLARALVGEPDVLLLDEPTNHLDLPTIEWLERTIAAFAGGVLMISHDRAFLTRISERVIWLERGRLLSLDAGYARFEDWQEKIVAEEAEAQMRIDKRIASETEWLGRSITARRKRNEGRKRRLLEMRARRAAWVGPQGRARLAAATDDSRSRLIIEAEGLSFAVPGPDGAPRPLVRDFSMRIMRGDRIGVIGPNGAGKTTLVRLLTGELAPQEGRVRIARTIEPAYFDQRRDSLDPTRTLWQTLAPDGSDYVSVRGSPRHVVGYLREFLFDDRQAKTLVGSLSGGERNRLMLARTLAQKSNLLVLDEPTNDLDMDTLDTLIDVLDEYEGTLLLVSHDRDFLDRLVNGVLVLEGDGTVEEFAGGYSDWLARRAAREETPRERRRAAPAAPAAPPAERAQVNTRLSYKEQRELDALPEMIERLGAEIDAARAKLADADFYARDAPGFTATTARLQKLEAERDAAEERWLALETRREELARTRRDPAR